MADHRQVMESLVQCRLRSLLAQEHQRKAPESVTWLEGLGCDQFNVSRARYRDGSTTLFGL